MIYQLLWGLAIFFSHGCMAQAARKLQFFAADHPNIQYTGRIDFTDKKLPRFWQPGVYIEASFTGSYCEVIVNDEVLWGKNHNYIEVVVDGIAKRLQTKGRTDTIVVANNLSEGTHSLVFCKNTEANIGYLELVGIRCKALAQPPKKPVRKIEFYGNSITCGASADLSGVPCGQGLWHDQHNAWLSYGARAARDLDAQFHLSAVSGIGLMRSCCGMNIIMPKVYDKVSMRNDTIGWDFNNYQPDVVTIGLGQNDGIQDSMLFIKNYIAFLGKLRGHYPNARFVCLVSPMADNHLKAFMQYALEEVVKCMHGSGDKEVSCFAFSRQYINGCDSHPDIDEHALMANELASYLKKIMRW